VPRRSRISPWPSGSCQLTNETLISAPLEEAGAHLVLDDAALDEHADQIEIVDREAGIASDRRALEAGIGTIDLTAEQDVLVVVGEAEHLPSVRVIRQIAARRVVPRRDAPAWRRSGSWAWLMLQGW
jgi:hypothetical protein